ncbi:MAG: AIM24 family protein [Thermoplasmata archaeon]
MQTDFIGDTTPIVLVKLERYEKIYMDNDIMLYKDPSVNVERRRLKVDQLAFPHKLYFAVFEGPGYVAISHDRPGECRPVTLQPNRGVYVRWGNLLFATDSVTYAPYFQTIKGDNNLIFEVGFENFMGPGEIYVQSFGNVFQFNLQPNERISVSANSLLMFDDTVKLDFAAYLVPYKNTRVGVKQDTHQPKYTYIGYSDLYGGGRQQASHQPQAQIEFTFFVLPGDISSLLLLLNVYGPGRVLVHSGR